MYICIEARGQTLDVDLYFSILFWTGSLCLCRPCYLAHKLLEINPVSTFHLCCRKCTSVADLRYCAWLLSGFCVPKLTYSGLHDIYFHSLSHLPLRYRGSSEFSSLQNRKRPPWLLPLLGMSLLGPVPWTLASLPCLSQDHSHGTVGGEPVGSPLQTVGGAKGLTLWGCAALWQAGLNCGST